MTQMVHTHAIQAHRANRAHRHTPRAPRHGAHYAARLLALIDHHGDENHVLVLAGAALGLGMLHVLLGRLLLPAQEESS